MLTRVMSVPKGRPKGLTTPPRGAASEASVGAVSSLFAFEAARPEGGQRRRRSLGDAQHRAPRARVAGNFGRRWLDRAPDDAKRYRGQRGLGDRHPRKLRVPPERLRRESEEALDDAILERMKADRREAPAALQQGRDAGQRGAHFVQLPVHRNPKGLESARRRILTPITPRPRADGLRDNRGELARRNDRSDVASLRNRSCNRPSKPFLTIVADHPGQFVDRCVRQELGPSRRATG